MEDMAHCAVHHESPAKYVCPACKNRPMCESCKQNHEIGTGHIPENFKEIGLALMNQHIQDAGGRLAKELTNELIKVVKELETGLLREIDTLQSALVNSDEQCHIMQKLDSEGRYAELYFYAKSLLAGGANNKAATGELNKRLLEMLDKSVKELKKVQIEIAAAKQYKPAFAAYKKGEVLVLEDRSYNEEEQIVSALKAVDMSTKVKAVYIDSWLAVGDCVASELASQLKAHPVSALYLAGNHISDAGAKVLTQAAFCNNLLSTFCIWSCRISDTGAKAVAEAARSCRSLTTLYLSGWKISDSGAKAVAEAVKGCPLSVFYLLGHRISNVGAVCVAEAVKSCPLSAFCLASNKMSDAGAIAVTKTVKDCQLSAFCLGGNKMSDAGAAAVAEILSSGGCANTLFAFYIGGGDISDSGVKKVADAVGGCPLLSEFYIESKPISGKTVAYILESMAGVSTIRSVNLRGGEISKEQMGFCLDRLQQSGVARQLKLRFRCDTEAAKSVCEKFEAEWNAKLAEFRIVSSIGSLFTDEVTLGVPK